MNTTRKQVYQIIARTIGTDGAEWSRVIFATVDPETNGQMVALVREHGADKPKTRAPTFGNTKRVRVLACEDTEEAARLLQSGALSQGFQAGHEFPSVKAASVAFGLDPDTLAQLFSRASTGKEPNPAIVVRGYRIQKTETK